MRWAYEGLAALLLLCGTVSGQVATSKRPAAASTPVWICDECPEDAVPVCVDGVTFRHRCLASCQGLSVGIPGACAGDDLLALATGATDPAAPTAAVAAEDLHATPSPAPQSEQARAASADAGARDGRRRRRRARKADMQRFRSHGFVLVGSLDLYDGPTDSSWDPKRAKIRTPQQQEEEEQAAAGNAEASDGQLQVRALRYTVADGLLYAESTSRPALGPTVRRALAAMGGGGGANSGGGSGGGSDGGDGDGPDGGWGSITATDGSEDAAATATAAAAAAAAATAAGGMAPLNEGLRDQMHAGGPSARRRHRHHHHRRSLQQEEQQWTGDARWRVRDAAAYPFSAVSYVIYKQPITGARFQCSATFISPVDVLTAAHCVWDFENNTGYRDWRVWPGLASSSTAATSPTTAYNAEYVTFYRTEKAATSAAASNDLGDINRGGATGSTTATDRSYPDQRYDVNYYDIALIRVSRPHSSWVGLKYDCAAATYPKTLACGYPATWPATYWQQCSQCYVTSSLCRPMWQMYNYCYSEKGQSGMAITDLTDLRVLGVLSGGPAISYNWSFWTPIDAFHFNNLVRWMWPRNGTDGPQPPPPPLLPLEESASPSRQERLPDVPRPPSAPPPDVPTRPQPPLRTPPPLSPLRPPPQSPIVTKARKPPRPPPIAKIRPPGRAVKKPPPRLTFVTISKSGDTPLTPPAAAPTSTPPSSSTPPSATATPSPTTSRSAALEPDSEQKGPQSALLPLFAATPPELKPVAAAPSGGVGEDEVENRAAGSSGTATTTVGVKVATSTDIAASTKECADGDVRLRDGPNAWSGRVELCAGGGRWGSICDVNWGWDDARVVCRQLGYGESGGEAMAGGWFPAAVATTPIHASNVACVGNEAKLSACASQAATAALGLCGGHQFDAGVICANGAVASPPPASGRTNGSAWRRGGYPCDAEGALRLVYTSPSPPSPPSAGVDAKAVSGDGGPLAGRVEVCVQGEWGSVCNDGWDDLDASVACRQLGFAGGWALNSPVLSTSSAATTSPLAAPHNMTIWMSGVDCAGGEQDLLSCKRRSPLGQAACSHQEDVGVVCSSTPTPPVPPRPPPPQCSEDGALRLQPVEGFTQDGSAGRLEVCYAGRYGLVCDDYFGEPEARVACRQLGFLYGKPMGPEDEGVAGDPTIGAPPGAAQTYWMDEVDCTAYDPSFNGWFSRLTQCMFNDWGDNDCDPVSEAAGVICSNDAGIMTKPPPPASPPPNPVGCTAPFSIRLAGGNSTAGRLEMCSRTGSWGTICELGWDNVDASVACRQLGFDTGLALLSATSDPKRSYPPGTALQPQLYYDMTCSGSESALSQCMGRAIIGNVSGCTTPRRDVGVACSYGRSPPPAAADVFACSQPQAIRLMYGINDTVTPEGAGRVEICYAGRWGSVCRDAWDDRDAAVVCRQLGLSNGTAVVDDRFGSASRDLPVWQDEVACRGEEAGLASCGLREWGNTDCWRWPRLDAGVVCGPPLPGSLGSGPSPEVGGGTPSPAPGPGSGQPPEGASAKPSPPPASRGLYACNVEGALRVVGSSSVASGYNTTTGRVDVCHAGQWGSVCGREWTYYEDTLRSDGYDVLWDDGSARVACRQFVSGLGRVSASGGSVSADDLLFSASALLPGDASFPGLPTGMHFSLSSVQCDGTEPTLDDCSRSGWGSVPAACGTGDAVGVRCVVKL